MKIKIEHDVEVEIMETDERGNHACHIKEYDMYFGAKSEDDIKRKTQAMINAWTSFHQKDCNK